MNQLYLIDKTEYIFAESEELAVKEYKDSVGFDPETIEVIDRNTSLFIFENKHGEKLWWFKYDLDGDVLIETTTVGKFFDEYCGESQCCWVYSTEW